MHCASEVLRALSAFVSKKICAFAFTSQRNKNPAEIREAFPIGREHRSGTRQSQITGRKAGKP